MGLRRTLTEHALEIPQTLNIVFCPISTLTISCWGIVNPLTLSTPFFQYQVVKIYH